MNFEYADEQKMLDESIVRLLSEHEPVHVSDFDDEARLWPNYAELGLLGMSFNEADGGLNAGPIETMIIMRAIGRYSCTAPYLASAVYGTRLLKALAVESQKSELVDALVSGAAQLAVAHTEPGARYRLSHVGLTAKADDESYILTGTKQLVLGGASASHFIVSARTSGGTADCEGITLFLLPRLVQGLVVARARAIDGRALATIHLEDVRVSKEAVLGRVNGGFEPILDATNHAIVAAINEAVGAMEEMLSITIEYLKTRKQFGLAIGSFQSLQHRAADLFIEVEQAKSMALYATMHLNGNPERLQQAVGAAKLYVNRCAKIVGEEAVQLHGAIGMTMESKVGRLFRRLAAFRCTFGDSDYWTQTLVESAPDLLAA